MLEIKVKTNQVYDDYNEEFIESKDLHLYLEHSLYSIDRWESIYHKSYINSEKTIDEFADYIKCMDINGNLKDIDLKYLKCIKEEDLKVIVEYIENPNTATTFSKTNTKPSREIITSEIIYYWMIELNIPLEFEKRHFNKLMTLIEVCNRKREENDPNRKRNKMNPRALASRNSKLNAARRKARNSRG